MPWLAILAPGILVATTGVGAGDLLTASIAGSKAGLVILWSALAGSFMKWTLNEGIARWQMATGTTLLEPHRRVAERAVSDRRFSGDQTPYAGTRLVGYDVP